MNGFHFMGVDPVNTESQDELLNELYRQMFIVAYAKMNNKIDAMDVVQESWVKILQKLDGLKDHTKLMQWAKVITANTAINAIKKKNQATFVPLFDDQMNVQELGLGIDSDDWVMKRMVYDGLAILDEDSRKMVLCKFFYQWKDQQIADMMDLPLGTTKARIHRAKQKLKAQFEMNMAIHTDDTSRT